MDPVEQRVKPVEVELGRNLQTYLQTLGLLPKTSPALGPSAPKVAPSINVEVKSGFRAR